MNNQSQYMRHLGRDLNQVRSGYKSEALPTESNYLVERRQKDMKQKKEKRDKETKKQAELVLN
jgi:hypothetical protein